MKKYLFLLLIIFITIFFSMGCTKGEAGNSFNAFVIESSDVSLLVEPEEGSQELRSADKIVISIDDETILESQEGELKFEDIHIGDRVEIFYNGEIAESYPAQIHGTYRIKLLDK